MVRKLSEISTEKNVPIGLLQGTALSVLLFIIYINDIVTVTDYSKIVMFADDTTITVEAKTYEEALSLVDHDLRKFLNG